MSNIFYFILLPILKQTSRNIDADSSEFRQTMEAKKIGYEKVERRKRREKKE